MAFIDAIRSELSVEAGGFCANPDCRVITGTFIPRQTRSAGDGAHIVAESLEGPRGQSPLTPEQRAMASNGVWLCPTCHRKVDIVRPQDYSIELLQQWKDQARIWWNESQGRSLQLVAWPDTRPQVARPNPDSLQGAQMFRQAHQSLAAGLSQLRGQSRRDIPIPEEIEGHIQTMSSSRHIGRSWLDEWSTTYHCNDRELFNYMRELVSCVDRLRRPPGPMFSRHVDFKTPNELAVGITRYLDVWDSFGLCMREHEKWGL